MAAYRQVLSFLLVAVLPSNDLRLYRGWTYSVEAERTSTFSTSLHPGPRPRPSHREITIMHTGPEALRGKSGRRVAHLPFWFRAVGWNRS
jgi:hypothetical protein